VPVVKPLAERNQATVGVVTLVVVVLVTLTAFSWKDLPLVHDRTAYTALFTESAGLASGDPVEVAGVKVGEVSDISLDGNRARVDFTVSQTWLGDRSTASIQIMTLLGQKYLALTPRGNRRQDPNAVIGADRTETPFQVNAALGQLSKTVDAIDTQQVAKAFDTLSDALSGTPKSLHRALSGLSKLSKTIASRDDALHHLLAGTSTVSKTVADRSHAVRALLSDGSKLLGMLQAREHAISSLLKGTTALAKELTGLVRDNQAQLGPALADLDKVTSILQHNQENLGTLLHRLAPYIRLFTNTVGNGRWFEGYLCGLLPPVLKVGAVTANQNGCTPPVNGSAYQQRVEGGGR
jgi:phospholipid/cholesterol/gamma-HCH transport system substrate-binding protein